jgi:hypothetical protein
MLTLIFVSICSLQSQAQYNTLYQHYYTPISGQALTVIDENNVQFDTQGNIYTMMDRESLRYSILSRLGNGGSVDWIDTLRLTAYQQSAVSDFKIHQQRIYTFCTYGNNLNSSNAEAVALTKYSLNGSQLNQVVLSNTGVNFRSQEIYFQPNQHMIITYLTNDAMTNWTLHVDCYDTSLNAQWTKSFPWPSYSNSSMPAAIDNQSSTYITYTTDSIVTGNYYRKAFIHKIDSSGNIVWTKNVDDKRYKCCKIDQAGNLIMAGETIAPLVIVSNNIGDVLVTKINAANGNQIWETLYNGTSNEKELVYSLDIDANNNILIAGNQGIQDISAAHYRGYANWYNTSGTLLKNILRPVMEVVSAAKFLSNGHPLLRSATSTMLYLSEFDLAGTSVNSNNYYLFNGASWAAMDILANDDIALAVSDQLCADRGVTVFRLSKNNANSVIDEAALPTITIYPNPAKQEVKIQCEETLQSVSLYDMLGQKQNVVISKYHTLDISTLRPGTYLLNIRTDKKDFKTKFVKE